MKFKFTAQVLFTSVAVAGMMAYAIEAQAIPTVGTGSGNSSTSVGSGSAGKPTPGISGGSNSSAPSPLRCRYSENKQGSEQEWG